MPSVELVDPLQASRHPFEVYLLVLAALSGVPLLFGKPNSGTIHATMPPAVVAAWGAMLLVGSLLALLGLYWRGGAATGLLLERTGLIGVGGSALIYAATLLLTAPGWSGAYAGCITAGFGAACMAQAHRIGQRIAHVLHEVVERRDD